MIACHNGVAGLVCGSLYMYKTESCIHASECESFSEEITKWVDDGSLVD